MSSGKKGEPGPEGPGKWHARSEGSLKGRERRRGCGVCGVINVVQQDVWQTVAGRLVSSDPDPFVQGESMQLSQEAALSVGRVLKILEAI